MSVSEQIPIVAYIANGTTSRFPITFDLQDARYLDVLLNKEVAQIASYTVENNTSVVFSTPPKVGDEIILSRSTALERETNFDNYDNSFRPETINWDLDKIWHKLQEDHVTDAYFLARLKSELETRRTADSLLQHQIDILNEVLLGVFENASSTYLADKLRELEKSLEDAINIAAASGAGSEGWTDLLVVTEDGVTTQRALNSKTVKNDTYAPVLGSPVILRFNPIMASFIYGISDPTHLDDNLNNFRGLNNPDAYHDSNVAIGAVSFGRNNPPFAYLSFATGHDCVPFGVASVVGGAGSCTGNPDVPNDGANYGYCSLAVGKDTQARGRISNAMGHLNLSESRYSSTDGYGCVAGGTQPSHPNYNLYGDDGAEGAAARAHGFVSKAYGSFAFAYGSMLEAYNGSQVIGKGINEGSPLIISKRGLGLGYNVDVPTIFCQGGQGVNGGHAPIGFNTDSPRNKYHFALKSGDTFNYVIDEVGSDETVFSQETVGKLSNGNYASLHNIVTYHTNATVASAIVEYRLNSSTYLKVDQSLNADFSASVNSKTGFYYNGVKVVGQRQAALAKLPSDASLADVIAKMNEIIEGLTNHGLFATPT